MNERSEFYKMLDGKKLRYGFTTGSVASAAAKAAFIALFTKQSCKKISIDLPHIQGVEFNINRIKQGSDYAFAEVIKFAGDDPDVTDKAHIGCEIRILNATPAPDVNSNAIESQGKYTSQHFKFLAGDGVGTITKAGLSLKIGQAAINPMPRKMICDNLTRCAHELGIKLPQLTIKISCKGGVILAKRTMNENLGILGGISILGTSGLVIPYSNSAWIVSIAKHIKVLAVEKKRHIVVSSGNSSSQVYLNLADCKINKTEIVQMGNYFLTTIKNANKYNFHKLTIVSGFGKLYKFALGADDTHSKKSSFELAQLEKLLEASYHLDREKIRKLFKNCTSANEALIISRKHVASNKRNLNLSALISRLALKRLKTLSPNIKTFEIIITTRLDGKTALLSKTTSVTKIKG